MSAIYAGLLAIGAICGAPLFVVLGGVALLLFASVGISHQAVIIELYRLASAPTLIAIPLFTFAGYILAESNSPKRMVELYRAIFGWMPGGLAIVSFVACAFFTAFTGASGVTIIALGGLLYPILINEKYSDKFSLGLLTAGGSLGLLFPPSLPLILYALIAQVNIDSLFLAGIVPGTLLVVMLSVYSIWTGRKQKIQRQKFVLKTVWSSFKNAGWIVPLPLVILAGIYSGTFTASEAAAIAAVYAFIVEVFIYRDVSLTKDIPRIAANSMILVGGVLIILGCAMGLTNYLVDEQIPMKIMAMMKTFITSKYVFLAVLNIFLLVVGCLMDIFSATIVVVPLIAPIAKEFGVNPIHLGIIFLTNLEIGYLTPPVGMNLFISSFRFKKPLPEIYRSVIPFIGVLLAALMIITYVPDLSLWLVKFFGLMK